eukprot:703010-Rhodomonas_salina.1
MRKRCCFWFENAPRRDDTRTSGPGGIKAFWGTVCTRAYVNAIDSAVEVVARRDDTRTSHTRRNQTQYTALLKAARRDDTRSVEKTTIRGLAGTKWTEIDLFRAYQKAARRDDTRTSRRAPA